MAYVDPIGLLEAFGDKEIAQRGWPDDTNTRPDAALLRATILIADRSAWTADEQAAADQAAMKLVGVVDRACDTIDSYRSAYFEPTQSPMLHGIGLDLARYWLYEDAATEIIRDRFNDAQKTLAALRDGKQVDGSVTSGATAGSAGMADFDTPGRIFTHDSLNDF